MSLEPNTHSHTHIHTNMHVMQKTQLFRRTIIDTVYKAERRAGHNAFKKRYQTLCVRSVGFLFSTVYEGDKNQKMRVFFHFHIMFHAHTWQNQEEKI